jgi:hypothetical protein
MRNFQVFVCAKPKDRAWGMQRRAIFAAIERCHRPPPCIMSHNSTTKKANTSSIKMIKMTRTGVLLVSAFCCLSSFHSGAWAWTSPVTRRSSGHGLTKLRMSDEAAMPDLTGKIIYQRVLHKLSEQSDVSMHNALSIEERIRFQPDPERGEGYLKPIGRRTLILRDKNEKELYRMDVHET